MMSYIVFDALCLNNSFKLLFVDSARRKEPLWGQVEQVCGNFSPDQILTSLMTNTKETTAKLKSVTNKVDIRKDAQNLR